MDATPYAFWDRKSPPRVKRMVRSGTRKTFLDCLGHRIKADGHNELALRETTSFRRTSPEGSEILAESQRHERKVNRTLAQVTVRTVRVQVSGTGQ